MTYYCLQWMFIALYTTKQQKLSVTQWSIIRQSQSSLTITKIKCMAHNYKNLYRLLSVRAVNNWFVKV